MECEVETFENYEATFFHLCSDIDIKTYLVDKDKLPGIQIEINRLFSEVDITLDKMANFVKTVDEHNLVNKYQEMILAYRNKFESNTQNDIISTEVTNSQPSQGGTYNTFENVEMTIEKKSLCQIIIEKLIEINKAIKKIFFCCVQ